MFRFRVLAAGVAVAVLAVLTVAAPASAHDELLASSPSPSEVLAAAPTEVSLQFSADVLTIGAVVVIVDAEGVDWVAGPVEFADSVVSAEVLPDMPQAGYELRWRVVSSDGHPIAGIVPFTIGDGEPLVRDAAATDSQDTQASGPQSQTEQESGVPVRTVLIGVGGAAIAVALFALVRFFLRRRQTSGGTGTPDP